MSDPLVLTIGAVVVALVLSVIWLWWRRTNNPRAVRTPMAANSDSVEVASSEVSIVSPTPEPTVSASQTTLVAAILALGAAGLGQYWLVTQRVGFAWFGYGAGVLIFVGSLWRFAPVNFEAAPPDVPSAKEPAPAPKLWPLFKAQPKASLTRPQTSARPAVKPTASPKIGFFNTWRYYTLADIINRREPKLPPPPELPITEVSEAISMVEAGELGTSTSPVTVIDAAGIETNVRVTQAIWTGFGRPESLAVAADGRIFVLDMAQGLIHELQLDGQVLNKWPVKLEDPGSIQRLAISPDGRTAYIADVERGFIYRIDLGEQN